ncbi:Msp1p [Sugiyamaella lignohabitans]|uniref:Msp1p n=1 Tax=Sugiyamaella lignohabitans TaxID=796027 RepID=A0A161HJG1_9ASCO|nr:Msp1p [Sugiyamaella lignohabitans]ANB12847.1 Msp1p [Sugiyamaella lignohabitans]
MSRIKFDPRVLADIAFLIGASASIYYLFSHLMSQIGDGPHSAEAKKKANASLQRLQARHPGLELELDDYEQIIVASVVTPAEIKVQFKDVGGLEDIIDELRESVLYPLTV